ncbi:MAG: ATP-dependent sacrificial sulfur transferase LarE [Oscillospiraceae bacterium]
MTLKDFFQQNSRVALAFSGGTDSSFLLWAAREYGAEVTAYFASSPFQPQFELNDAKKLAAELGAKLKILELSPLDDAAVRCNGPDRCYHCKKKIFGAISTAAHRDGYPLIIDGTNASDDEGDRPGMRALREMGVRSPLRECGITKPEVRSLSRKAGLFTGDKPAYACLATRVPTGTPITSELLEKIEKGEAALFALGFSDFRLRLRGSAALLQLRAEDMPMALVKRRELRAALKPYFDEIHLDLAERAASL